MSIKSPETYGEQFWAPQLEVQIEYGESVEESIKPFIPDLFSDPEIRAAIPFDILPKLEALLEFPSSGLGEIGGRFISEAADNIVGRLLEQGLQKFDYATGRMFQGKRMAPAEAGGLFRQKRVQKDFFDERYRGGGYSELEQYLLYQESAPFPSLPELFRWARYHGDPTNIWSTLADVVDLKATDYPRWDWLNQQQLSFEQINTMYKRRFLTESLWSKEMAQLGWSADNQTTLAKMIWPIPNAMLILQGNLHQEKDGETIDIDLAFADIHPEYRKKYIDAVLTKPASQDLIRYHLLQDNRLENLEKDLTRIGIHPDYMEVYKTLAYPIPPVSDLITMAVREAFSPAVAARFGQYEDFPAEFAKYAKMSGLSEEWAERYWAAHWNLPSPQQGFQMLHRGVIDKNELSLLLRAQDVMPFWRDRLIQIAYKTFTRVDVRRMYKEGVLDEKDVYKAYLDQGYKDENAEHMTEFTIKQTLSSLAKFTSTDIIRAYTKRMIGESEAISLLQEIGIKSEDSYYIVRTAEYKRVWDFTQDRITAIKNFYKRGVNNEDTTRSELNRLNLPSDQTTVLMDTWYYEKKEKKQPTWSKADVLKFITAGTITKERGIRELELIGYDKEHIDVYMVGVA